MLLVYNRLTPAIEVEVINLAIYSCIMVISSTFKVAHKASDSMDSNTTWHRKA